MFSKTGLEFCSIGVGVYDTILNVSGRESVSIALFANEKGGLWDAFKGVFNSEREGTVGKD